ncbi:glycosyl hydrolase [Bosea sp. BK604]|uniref:GH39 family glycosyl hydrolase n=1 Tax=Bosea sp. BK604 TaxID=2512180 RepID=UPI0010484DA9|nr:glycosyl hydrolase [Bosea sp. BK604]TCR67673.1 L-iduronidase [Bosea sp. BK604]
MPDTSRIRVDLSAPTQAFRRFWRSTGFSPGELLLEPEMQQTLAYVGGVPNRGIEYMRVHYMLDLVTATGFGSYDFSRLDAALDIMLGHRIRPFLELMGNPSYIYTDFNDVKQAHHWRDFITELAQRYRARYGAEELRQWYFETWNEPDIWWKLGGETGFNNYYDACSEALKAVDPELKLGGPGVARRIPPIFKSFLAHCDTGTNLFTGETGVRLDFISVHEKGARKHAEDLTPNSLSIVRHEMMAVDYVREHHPRFASLPFINNECDPQIGWHLYHTWHAMPYFAGLAAKIIDQHQRLMVDAEGVDYDILSNDNGFVGHWGHRTHLTYFGNRPVKPAQAEHKTDIAALEARRANPEPFELVKKPALSVMELFGLLSERRFRLDDQGLDPDRAGLGAIATAFGSEEERSGASVLLYNSVDRIWRSGEAKVELDFAGLQPGAYALASFRIAHGKGDPFTIWEDLGAPDLPNPAELEAMRLAQEPALSVEHVQIGGATAGYTLPLDMPLPSVALVALVRREGEAPGAPSKLKARHFGGLNGRSNLVLFWEPAEHRSVQLFDVLWSGSENGPWQVINPVGLLSSVYLHPAEAKGFYKVRARDLFGRISTESAALEV